MGQGGHHHPVARPDRLLRRPDGSRWADDPFAAEGAHCLRRPVHLLAPLVDVLACHRYHVAVPLETPQRIPHLGELCLRLFQCLGPRSLPFLPRLPKLASSKAAQLLGFPLALPSSLDRRVRLVAPLPDVLEQLIGTQLVRIQIDRRALHDLPWHSQPAGDRQCVGAPGHADHQAVGGRQGLDVKLDAGVLHPRSRVGVGLDL